MNNPALEPLISQLDEIPELISLIRQAIDESAQRVITEGGH